MSYTCKLCGATSHNENDERERYCGRCHHFDKDDNYMSDMIYFVRIHPPISNGLCAFGPCIDVEAARQEATRVLKDHPQPPRSVEVLAVPCSKIAWDGVREPGE
jgi:hypothetical protein